MTNSYSFTGYGLAIRDEKTNPLWMRIVTLKIRRCYVRPGQSRVFSQPEIASVLHVGIGIVSGDLSCLIEQAKSNVSKYIDERFPQDYEKCLIGLLDKKPGKSL